MPTPSSPGIVQILASGSSGNAAFIRQGETRVLLDAGISLRRIRRGLEAIGESLDALDAVLVTHEHGDHVKGLERLLTVRPELPIHASAGTIAALDLRADFRALTGGAPADIGELECVPFDVNHDAAEPLGFRIEGPDGARIGWVTDLGFWTDEVAEALEGCQLLFVEANYDPTTLDRGPYPWFLKKRISGSGGHLSNFQTRALVERVASSSLEKIVLGHLSEKNNTPGLATSTVKRSLDGSDVELFAAARKEPSPLIALSPGERPRSARQTSLF